jgi:hypothetical protein
MQRLTINGNDTHNGNWALDNEGTFWLWSERSGPCLRRRTGDRGTSASPASLL